ncbi:hypothetical protein, partial [Klebsiella pneumoniae]
NPLRGRLTRNLIYSTKPITVKKPGVTCAHLDIPTLLKPLDITPPNCNTGDHIVYFNIIKDMI